MALTEQQLAALDLMIYAKKANIAPAGFININDVVNDVVNVAAAVVVVAEAVEVTAAVIAASATYRDERLQPGGRGLSLEDLMIIRKQALER